MDTLLSPREFMTGLDNFNFPLDALERCTSNPLIRCVSNISCTSEDGATFVPFGRSQGYDNDYIDYSTMVPDALINALIMTQYNDENTMNDKESGTKAKAPVPSFELAPKAKAPPVHVPQTPRKHVDYDGDRRKRKKEQRKSRLHAQSTSELIKLKLSLLDLLELSLICRFFSDQNGSRYVQDLLMENASSSVLDSVLKHIIFDEYEILNLSMDIYANYVVQILFEIGSKSQHELLVKHLLKGNVYGLSHSFYGCRVLQKAFDCIDEEETMMLIAELNSTAHAIKECMIGQNSNHVLQKILSLSLGSAQIEFIWRCVASDLYFYSSHIFGCRIVQMLINNYGDLILDNIVNSRELIVKLSRSEYGNYVIQDILALADSDSVQSMVRLNVFSNVVHLSRDKFGSNVVEKCLLKSTVKERDLLLKQIMCGDILVKMVKDKYANYVVQKLLIRCTHKQQSQLIYLIEKNLPNLRGSSYGKHIADKISKIKSKYKKKKRNYY